MGSRQEPRRLSRHAAGVGHGKGTSWCLCSSNEDLVQPMKEALHSCAAQVGKLHFAARCRAEQWSGAERSQHHSFTRDSGEKKVFSSAVQHPWVLTALLWWSWVLRVKGWSWRRLGLWAGLGGSSSVSSRSASLPQRSWLLLVCLFFKQVIHSL